MNPSECSGIRMKFVSKILELVRISVHLYSQKFTRHMETNMSYHADTNRIGKSGLDLVHKAPIIYWQKYLDPNRVWDDDQTPSMLLGSATHCAVFEPEQFANRYAVLPKIDRRTNAGKAAWEEFSAECQAKKLTAITTDQYDATQRMAEAVYSHPMVSQLLALGGPSEYRIDFTDPRTGAAGKMKADRITPSGIILDLKTTADASPEGFAKSCANYRYHVQDAWYSDGFAAATNVQAQAFIFIAVEAESGIVKPYTLDADSRALGREQYQADLDLYLECLRTNTWPAYGDDISELRLPSWAFKSI